MTVRVVSVRRRRLAVFMMSTAIASVLSVANIAQAQQAPDATVAVRSVQVSIPGQPLDRAISAFIRQTGVQVGYATALVAGRTSAPVSGRLDPIAALRTLLSGSGIGIQVTGARTVSLVGGSAEVTVDDGSTVLDTITVTSGQKGLTLGSGSPADSGTTSLDATQIGIRTDGGGDANTFLRGLPNVQYQNDTDDDAGIDNQDILNLRPMEMSISGGRTNQNNFIVDGIAINTVTGADEDRGNGELSDTSNSMDAERIYGLHSQTIFVPGAFLDAATVIDSNASAQYGSFLGGVVSYKLREPATDRWKASTEVDYQSDDMVRYNLGTEDGTNPNSLGHPEFRKKNTAFSVTGPVTDNIAVIAQYSHADAWTDKARDYRYGDERIESESKNDFYRFQANADTDLGLFKLSGMHTDYHQDYQSAIWRDLEVDTETQTYAGKLENLYEFGDVTLGGVSLSNLTLTSKLTATKSDTLNLGGDDVSHNYRLSHYSGGALVWQTALPELLEWCRVDYTKTSTLACSDGGQGSERGQGQTQYTFAQQATADIWAGNVLAGYDLTLTEGRRWRAKDLITYTYISRWDRRTQTAYTDFTCATTEACNTEQFANSKRTDSAYNITAQMMAVNAYLEFDQTIGWFNLRSGVRVDYDDYQKNVNIAPRLVATVSPNDGFSLSAGYNRYYEATSLAYAIRDKQPRFRTQTRNNNATTGVVSDNWSSPVQTYYLNNAANLKTPYADEYAAAATWTDPLTEGEWRLRYVNRQSKDQLATSVLSNTSKMLTNSATASYTSVTGEYVKELPVGGLAQLDSAAMSASVTWAKRDRSADSYFDDEDDFEDRIYYKGNSYSRDSFNAVTGNMDIPLRAQMGIASSWFEERLKLGAAANINFAYKGVTYTNENTTVDGVFHEVWDDKDFSTVLTVDLAGSYKVWQENDRGLTLNFKLSNLFNEMGNATATAARPWLTGRTLWVGASAEF